MFRKAPFFLEMEDASPSPAPEEAKSPKLRETDATLTDNSDIEEDDQESAEITAEPELTRIKDCATMNVTGLNELTAFADNSEYFYSTQQPGPPGTKVRAPKFNNTFYRKAPQLSLLNSRRREKAEWKLSEKVSVAVVRYGPWSKEEKASLTEGLKLFGEDYAKVADLIGTRSHLEVKFQMRRLKE